jgi:NADH-quinone oxidoreductase subunit H
VWIFIIAIARLFRDSVSVTNTQLLVGGAIVIAVLLIGSWLFQLRADKRDAAAELELNERRARPFDANAGGYPVPPLPGERFEYTSRRAMAAGVVVATTTVAVAAPETTNEEAPDA